MDPVLVTSNKGKLREMRLLLGARLESTDVDLPEIQEIEARKVAQDKARRAYGMIGRPVLVEDSGLYIKALNNFPGALVKWLTMSVGNEGICRIVDCFDDRSAYAEACLTLYDGGKMRTFVGRVDGQIAKEPRGEKGFGWDAIFIMNGKTTTFAELETDEKTRISHRGIATAKLIEYLTDTQD